MAAEMWRMPSGRIGTIDLDQPADAVDALRELLASQGAVKEEAPASVAAENEGEMLSTSAMAKMFGVSKSSVARDVAAVTERVRVVRGLDGKLYTIRNGDDRMAIVSQVHALRHGGLSVRGVVDVLDAAGVRRSVGAVHADLRDFICAECSGDANATPEQKNALDAAATAVEGEIQNTNQQEGEQIVHTILPDTDDVRTAIREWAQAVATTSDVPEWPKVATPWWASVEIGFKMGGEVDVSLERRFGSVAVQVIVSVVVDAAPEFDHNHEGAAVGDYFVAEDGAACILVRDGDDPLSLESASEFARSFAQALQLLHAIQGATGRAGTGAVGALTHTEEIDRAVREWTVKHLSKWASVAEGARQSIEFRNWFEDVVASWPEEYAIAVWAAENERWAPEWPAELTPWWATSVDVGAVEVGEVCVSFEREFFDAAGNAIARLRHGINVVFDASPRFDRNHPGAEVGDWVPVDASAVTLAIEHGKSEDLGPADVAALADALAEARAILEQLETWGAK